MSMSAAVGANHVEAVTRTVRRLRRLAWLVDGAFRIPGLRFRFGLNSLIGLVPGGGDVILASVSLYIVYQAYRLGVTRAKLLQMLGNIAIEFVGGAVPLLGDLFDMAFKANLRNIALLEQHFGLH